MGRGTSRSVKAISQVFALKNVNIRYMCLFQIKCAIMRCIFDFYYTLKEKHFRSPPTSQFTKTIWLEEKEMQYEVDEYIVEHIEETDKYYIYFKDSVNNECKIEIDKKIYDAYMESKKAYIRIKNQNTRYEEQSEQTEISLYTRAFLKTNSIEDEFIRKIELEKLNKAKQCLTEKQRRRIELHIEENKTIPEIAKIEGVCRTKIDKSIAQGLKKLKIFLKQGVWNSQKVSKQVRGYKNSFTCLFFWNKKAPWKLNNNSLNTFLLFELVKK